MDHAPQQLVIRTPRRRGLQVAAWLALAGLLSACTGPARPRYTFEDAYYSGRFGQVRELYKKNLAILPDQHTGGRKVDRNYLLDRQRLMMAMLADGYAPPNSRLVERVYELLRTQGLNKDKTVTSVVLNEDLKIWKGEPFEQAMAFHYIGLYYAMQSSWDNTRAAVLGSLFHLRDFGADAQGQSMKSQDLVKEAATRPNADYLDTGYVAEESNFTLGYLMVAIANQQLARANGDAARLREAGDNFNYALKLQPRLGPLIAQLRQGNYNTLLVVDAGLGPQKVGVGPDRAIAAFEPRSTNESSRLRVNSDDLHLAYEHVIDLNQMAADHRWNNLEDVRKAKSLVGSLLMGGGAVAAVAGTSSRNDTVALAGLAAMALGAVSKAGAHADTRYNEALPQRVFLVPLELRGPRQKIMLQIEGQPGTRLVLTGISPPKPAQPALLRYVRLLAGESLAQDWATSGSIVHGNDRTGPADAPSLPYILGGRDLRTPSPATMRDYYRAGLPSDLTYMDLLNLCNDEGLVFEAAQEGGVPGQHVLEGGRSLVPPLEGTLGFARLFCGYHPDYVPRSRSLLMLRQRMQPPANPTAGDAVIGQLVR